MSPDLIRSMTVSRTLRPPHPQHQRSPRGGRCAGRALPSEYVRGGGLNRPSFPQTPQPLFCLSLRIFQQAVRKIPCAVHDAFDTKGIAFQVKEQVAVKRSFYLNAPNVSEFGGLKVADRLKKAGRDRI